MPFARATGILLHPSSLPARGGIGDFGPAAYEFVDFLAAAGQGLWQVLPLGPLGYGNSPYSATSAFAGTFACTGGRTIPAVDGLAAFIEKIYKREKAGHRFTPQDADTLGKQAQDRAVKVAGQVSQAAAKLGVKVEGQ
jgi:4-alpha-glucanotransferase